MDRSKNPLQTQKGERMPDQPENPAAGEASGGACPCCEGASNSTEPAPAKPERKNAVLIPFIVALLAMVGLLLLLIHYLNGRKPNVPPQPLRPVKTQVVQPVNGAFNLKYPGQTRAIQQVDIGFQVSGSLVELLINSGDVVKKDQVIARLDPRDYQNKLDAANADYLNAKTNLERQQSLYASATIPKSKLDDAVAAFKVAEANMKIAEKARQDCVLKASFDGVIAKRYVDNYQTVSAGQQIVSLQDLTTLEVEVDFPEWIIAKARQIAAGAKATAEFDTLPGKIIDLRVREFAAEADPQTRTYAVRFTMLNNPDTAHVSILPGMTSSVTITVTPPNTGVPVFILPVWSVASDGKKDEPYVYVVDDKVTPWVVHQRKVTVGELTGDSILIKSGLQAGDRVVIAGTARLSDGKPVRDLPAFLKSGNGGSSAAQSLGTEQTMPAGTSKPMAPFDPAAGAAAAGGAR